jgi:hypothetical protein
MVTKTKSRLEQLVKHGEAVFRPADPEARKRPIRTFKLKRGMRLERAVKKH